MNPPETRIEALERYARLMASAKLHNMERDVERHLARTDLWYLMVRILRRVDLNKDFFFDRCREVEVNRNGYLDLWAREHGKSSIVNFGMTIQDILRDPE